METCVLIPKELSLATTTITANHEAEITVWTTSFIEQGTIFYPFQGTIRWDKLDAFQYLDENDVSISHVHTYMVLIRRILSLNVFNI